MRLLQRSLLVTFFIAALFCAIGLPVLAQGQGSGQAYQVPNSPPPTSIPKNVTVRVYKGGASGGVGMYGRMVGIYVVEPTVPSYLQRVAWGRTDYFGVKKFSVIGVHAQGITAQVNTHCVLVLPESGWILPTITDRNQIPSLGMAYSYIKMNLSAPPSPPPYTDYPERKVTIQVTN